MIVYTPLWETLKKKGPLHLYIKSQVPNQRQHRTASAQKYVRFYKYAG